MHNTTIEIDSKQFVTNLAAIRQHVGNKVKICLPVKANAYGHGLVAMCKIAENHVDYFGVACKNEGSTLRAHKIHKPILVFGGFTEEEIAGLIDNNLEITISSSYKAQLVATYCQKHNKTCRVHIKVDTGMNRVGVRVESAKKLIEQVMQYPQLQLVGIYSHLASSDELDSPAFTIEQIRQFQEVVSYAKSINPGIICHLANSGGVCHYPDSFFDMVRPGILAYGYFPAQTINTVPLNQIKPCFCLKTKVTYFKVVAEGQGISYNHQYITKSQTRIITLAIGYGDGYRRLLSNCGELILREHKYTISGIICMDICMSDIGMGEAYVGDEVILIGKSKTQEITLESVAAKCHTITYEILCGFNGRIPRLYI